jgi:recombinational DNA repair protein RecR
MRKILSIATAVITSQIVSGVRCQSKQEPQIICIVEDIRDVMAMKTPDSLEGFIMF